MKNLGTKLLTYSLPVIMWFIIMFDPSGIALGSTLITLPPFLLGTAELLGNMIWVLGLILLIISGVLITLLAIRDLFEKLVEDTIKATAAAGVVVSKYTLVDKDGNKFLREQAFRVKAINIVNIIFSFLAIGTGFWFTGTAWLLTILLSMAYRKVGLEIIDVQIKQYFKDVEEELENERIIN